MAFNREELLKVAQLSALKLSDEEAARFEKGLASLLSYIDEIASVQTIEGEDPHRQINVFREDRATSTDTAPLLAQAPQREETYFVVPKILEE